MNSAKQVDQMVKDWKQEGLSKPDIIVLPIPYSETSNPKGGLTVHIGGD